VARTAGLMLRVLGLTMAVLFKIFVFPFRFFDGSEPTFGNFLANEVFSSFSSKYCESEIGMK
jgi:hypothetical protein